MLQQAGFSPPREDNLHRCQDTAAAASYRIYNRGDSMKMTTSLIARRTLISCLLAASIGSLSVTASAGAKTYGGGAPANSSALPAGDFRTALEALPASQHERAMQWLQSVEFTEHDLEHLRVDKQGSIYYADTFATDKKPSGDKQQQIGTTSGINEKNILKLHSRPGAANTIFVDFDGATISETAWNSNAGVRSWKARPYDADNNPQSFNAEEVSAMADIWRRIAEDFAPFNVDITTEDPGRTRANTAWVLVTHSEQRSTQPLPHPESSSVAYMNILGFSHTGYYSPAMVYYNNLEAADLIAGAVSHNVGHMLGLSHDTPAASGKSGDQGLVSWAPVMGLDHRKHVTQWSNGDYPGAVNTQNDVGILIGAFDLRGDDHADSRFDRGTPLVADGSGRIVSSTPATDPENRHKENKGLIEDSEDIDVFVFDAGSGTVDITVTPAWVDSGQVAHRGANLDVHVALFNAAGKKVAENDPRNDTSSNLKTRVSPGRYKLEIQGVGNAAGPYSSYGSIGQYYISGSVPPTKTTLAKSNR